MTKKTGSRSSRSATSTTSTSKRTATTTTTRETKRVTSLEPKKQKALTSLEEAVVRMHHGVSVKPQAQLPTNGVTDELMGQLFEMEVRAHVESGRIDTLPEVPATKSRAKAPANARTAKVVAELKKKK
jgi:hypothetical protein